MAISYDHPIIIVGGGTFGLSTALALSKNYTNITVFDRFDPPVRDASSTDINKVIRADYGSDLIYQQLALDSIEIFKQWNETETIFHQTGVMLVGEKGLDENSYQSKSYQNLCAVVKAEFLVKNEELDLDEYPYLKALRQQYPSGYLNKLGGWCDSSKAISHVVKLLKDSKNVSIKTGIAGTFVKLVETKGQVVGVEMKDGICHRGLVILATGAWTPTLLPITKDLMVCNGQPVLKIQVNPILHKLCDKSPVWAIFGSIGFYGFPPTANGTIKIARHGNGYINPINGISSPLTVITDPSKSGLIPKQAFINFQEFIKLHFPFLKGCSTSSRICYYTDTVDGDFLITRIPHQDNLILATGGSGHAFKFFPVIGKVVEDLVEGRVTDATKRFGWREKGADKKEASRSGFGDNEVLTDLELVGSCKL